MYMEYQPVSLEVSNSFLRKPIVCKAGYFNLPDGPGLGIEVDEEKVRQISTIY
jgi:L-alanine-DL-glutamate epimerase-like enolase superfamily enzyme